MSTQTKVPQTPNQDANAPRITSKTLESTVRNLCSFASSPEMKIASTIILEIQNQQEQIKAKDDELSELRKKLEEQEEKRIIAIDQWFLGAQTQKSKLKDAEAEIQSLHESNAKKDSKLEESVQKIKTSEEEKKKAHSDHLNEKNKTNQLRDDITALIKQLKEKNGIIEKLQAAKLAMTSSLSSEREKTEELGKELTSMKSIAHESQLRLQKLEGYGFRGHQMDEDSMADGFSGLWEYAQVQLHHMVMQNVDGGVLSNKSLTGGLQNGDVSVRDVPLPLSYSFAAKAMRLAVILAILSREIDKCVFQPNYLVPEDAQMRTTMSQLAETDSDKESFCRSMLLSIDQQHQQETLQHRINNVVRKVSSCARDWLTDAQHNEFQQRVASIVQKAIDVWLPIQRAQQKYESDFDPVDWDDTEWTIFNLPGENTEKGGTSHFIASDTLLTVFPRLSQVKDNVRVPLTFVTQLTKSHPLCIQAEQELGRKANSPTIGRMPSSGTRRKSVVANASNGNGFLKKKTNGA